MATAVVEKISRLSTEFIHVKITSDVDYSSDPVSFAVLTPGVTPGDLDWVAGETFATGAKVLVGPGTDIGELPIGKLSVWVRLTDNPETPVKLAGQIIVF